MTAATENQNNSPNPPSDARVSKLAGLSIGLAISGIILSPLGGIILCAAGAILGIIAIILIKKNPQHLGGLGLACTGITVGIISIAGILIVTKIFSKVPGHPSPGTNAQLNGIDSAIRKYVIDFNDLPGVYPQLAAAPGQCQTVGDKSASTFTATDNKISGPQNLLLALAYTFNGTTGVAIPGNNPYITPPGVLNPPLVDITAANGPYFIGPSAPSKQYPPYYSPTKDDLKTTSVKLTNVPYAWISSTGSSAFPAIVDRFADPLPILYFRRDQAAGYWCTDNKSVPASYYRQENSEYLDAVITSAAGVSYDQKTKSPYSASNPSANANLAAAIMAQIGPTSSTATAGNRGDFILISAGPDRIYGTADDLIHVTQK